MYGKCESFFVMQISVSCVHPVTVLNAAFCMTWLQTKLITSNRSDLPETLMIRQH